MAKAINRRSNAGGSGGGPKTPAFLKENYRSTSNTPGLPEVTRMDDDGTYSDEVTPVPQIESSSAQSTPLPMLPGRDGGGILGDGQNMMTLKEQERVITLSAFFFFFSQNANVDYGDRSSINSKRITSD